MAGLKLGFSAIRELGKAIAGTTETRQQTKKAIVREVTDGGAVVEVAGSGVLTPVESSAATYGVGDVVTVSNRGGKLHIDGDVSAPSVGAGYVRKTVQPVAQAVAEAAQTAAEGVKAGADAQKAADEAKATANATNQHFFADTDGAHITDVTQDEWNDAVADEFSDYDPDTKPYHNQLLNSLGILLRTALNNLVSITRSAIAFYDGTGNAASNIVARFGADGAQVGVVDGAHSYLAQDYHSLQLVDRDSYTYFHVSDLRNEDGSITETFEGDGTTTEFKVMAAVSSAVSVNVDGVSASYTLQGTTFALSSAPASGATVEICYVPTDTWKSLVKAYTFGIRKAGRVGLMSVAEGYNNTASGEYSHAEGMYTTTSGLRAHAEGRATTASGYDSHAEGDGTQASGDFSHAEGLNSKATDSCSHAEGYNSTASGRLSHAQNEGTVAAYDSQTAIGKYNANGPDNAFEIGNGTADNARSNALTTDWNGNVAAAGGVTVHGHSSPIGSVLSNTKNSISRSGTAIDTMTNGASVTLTAGVWVVCGYWAFNSGSVLADSRSMQVALGTSGATDYYERVRVAAHNSAWATLECSCIVNATSSGVTVYVKGAASVAQNSARLDNSHIKAVRIV